jgi:uncharacterized membrane-anchored protein
MDKANKVARITLIFWLMKIGATTLGETLGDLLSMTLGLGYLVGLLITLGGFLRIGYTARQKKYIALVYRVVIIGTTMLGTEWYA